MNNAAHPPLVVNKFKWADDSVFAHDSSFMMMKFDVNGGEECFRLQVMALQASLHQSFIALYTVFLFSGKTM